MANGTGWCHQHRLSAVVARLVGRGGRWLPVRAGRRPFRLGEAHEEAGPPAPEELEALVATVLGTPRPPVAPAPSRAVAGYPYRATHAHAHAHDDRAAQADPWGVPGADGAPAGYGTADGHSGGPTGGLTGRVKTPPASDTCDPEPPDGPADVGRRAAHEARVSPAASATPDTWADHEAWAIHDDRATHEACAAHDDRANHETWSIHDDPASHEACAAHATLDAHATHGPRPRAGAVHGYVVTPDGDPLHGVTLTLLSRVGRRLDRVTSLADGSYALAAPAPGMYLLTATAPGYAPRVRHLVLADGPLTYDLELVEAIGGGVSAV